MTIANTMGEESRPVVVKPFDFADPVAMHQRRLPHWRQEGCAYFITSRLADSLPQPLLREWAEVRKNWIEHHPPPWSDTEADEYHTRFTERMDEFLHAGKGACVLGTPDMGYLVEAALYEQARILYELGTFVVMPNHVHLLVLPMAGVDLSNLVQRWKGATAHTINQRLGRTGMLWAPEPYDHIVRNHGELVRLDTYIRANPDKAGLHEGRYRIGGTVANWVFSAPVEKR